MGLDMYLSKVKRIDNADLKDILNAGNYLTYLDDDHKEYSMEEWMGVDESEVDKTLAKKYESEFYTRYYSWDDEKKYGHKMIVDHLADWRKANQIHHWFVENVQDGFDDCGYYEVTQSELETLLDLCKRVKNASVMKKGKIQNGYRFANGVEEPIMEDGEYILDPTVAEELLPATSGFFFGSTAYDQWYMMDIEHTIDVLEKVLRETDFVNEIVFYSSSW